MTRLMMIWMCCWGLWMNKYFLNELSLNGQFNTVDDFIRGNKGVMECIRWVSKRECVIYKKSDFYYSMITQDKSLYCALGGYRPSDGEISDLLRKYKLLLELISANPYWDSEMSPDGDKYVINGFDLGGSSVEAAARMKGALFSFVESCYSDQRLIVEHEKERVEIYSISSTFMLSEFLRKNEVKEIDEFVKLRYRDSNLDFSRLESRYGFSQFQKDEIEDCIRTFDRFVNMSWDQIYEDNAIRFKHYDPSSQKENWFSNSEYNTKNIGKFRCVNPKRCFGYREGDKFYVLRMERDHSISDHG